MKRSEPSQPTLPAIETARGPARGATQLEGTVESVVYRGADGRYAVVRVLDESGKPAVVVGDLGGVAAGEHIRFAGRFTEHARYGRRFVADAFSLSAPTTPQGILRYLGSGLISGVGEKLAERIVDTFGTATLDVIARAPERLREVPTIGKKRAAAIAGTIRDRWREVEAMAFLRSLGIGAAVARRLYKRYGDETPRTVQQQPYRLAEEVEGIGFPTADRIARAAGVGADDPRRAQGAVLHALRQGADEGHVFLPRENLLDRVQALDVPPALAEDAIDALAGREAVVVEAARAYLPDLYAAERDVAERLKALAVRATPLAHASVAAALGSTLSADQRRAVEAATHSRLVVVTGGPGTGKTTTVRAILNALRARTPDSSAERVVALAAPTGRAAKRLSEAARSEATTLHRLLEWNPRTGSFVRDASHPLELDALVVDEASMLDLPLASRLLAALPSQATLVLVGDVDQLPPVGPGQVLKDVIDSGIAETVRLHEIFRQARDSAIVRAAHQIRMGQRPEPSAPGVHPAGDLHFVRADDPARAVERIVELCAQRIPEAYGLDPVRDVQVLVPVNRGTLGVDNLNLALQAALNPDGAPAAAGLRIGDKVMQLRNDYEREIYNGDLGQVVGRSKDGVVVSFVAKTVVCEGDALDALRLAYAATVHKSQGSEFAAVIVAIHPQHHVMLARNLLYTAVTRAKKLVVLVGSERAIARAVKNASAGQRFSGLCARLRPGPATRA